MSLTPPISPLTTTLVLFLLILSPTAFAATPPPFTRIYAFGDSYTDTGNTRTSTGPTAFNFVSNPPYGITFFHRPTNRYSDGRIVIDFVAKSLSLPQFLPPYLDRKADRSHGVNFAVGGATAIRHAYFVKNNVTFNLVPQSLETQLVWFNKVAASEGCRDVRTTPRECKAVLGNALVWLGEIGANDYTCSIGSSVPTTTIRTLALNSVTGFLQALLNKGAKYIVVQGLPPTGCSTYTFSLSSPDDRDASGCVASANEKSRSHNAALQAVLAQFRKQHPQAIIAYADYYNSLLRLLKGAKRYGFSEPLKACCGYGGGKYNFDVFNTCGSPASKACADPSRFINWDGAHFTEAVYRRITEWFLNGTDCTPPFRYLVSKKLQSG